MQRFDDEAASEMSCAGQVIKRVFKPVIFLLRAVACAHPAENDGAAGQFRLAVRWSRTRLPEILRCQNSGRVAGALKSGRSWPCQKRGDAGTRYPAAPADAPHVAGSAAEGISGDNVPYLFVSSIANMIRSSLSYKMV
jgi:hypothetical protein